MRLVVLCLLCLGLRCLPARASDTGSLTPIAYGVLGAAAGATLLTVAAAGTVDLLNVENTTAREISVYGALAAGAVGGYLLTSRQASDRQWSARGAATLYAGALGYGVGYLLIAPALFTEIRSCGCENPPPGMGCDPVACDHLPPVKAQLTALATALVLGLAVNQLTAPGSVFALQMAL